MLALLPSTEEIVRVDERMPKAFEDLKRYLSSPPLLSPSVPGEELYLYIAVSQAAVSAALVREDGHSQRPIYFVSRAFRGAEERYLHIREIGPCPNDRSTETQTVFPGPRNRSPDGPASEESNEQPRGGRKEQLS